MGKSLRGDFQKDENEKKEDLVGQRAGNDHAIGLTRRGTHNNTITVEVITTAVQN
jgi:hypothetical protein